METKNRNNPSNNQEVAKLYVQKIWADKDIGIIDTVVHEQVIIHTLFGDFHGRTALKSVISAWLKGFPDLKVENDHIISDNDRVCIQWHAKGTHKGEFKGLQPTGKSVAYAGATIYRIESGQIVEYWAYIDMQHLLSQLR